MDVNSRPVTELLTVDNPPLSTPTLVPPSAVNLPFIAYPCTGRHVLQYVEAALSVNTRRAYRCDLDNFLRWGGSLPSSPETVACYLADCAGRLSVATLARRVASIARAHTSQGLSSPTRADLVKTTLRGIRRTYGVAQRQVAPALVEDVLAMVKGLSGTKGTRDRALLLLGFAGAFRRSEVVAIEVSDIDFLERGLTIRVRRSKTDQEGAGRKVAIPFARGPVCPVQCLKDWLVVSNITEGPVFRAVTRHGDISTHQLSGNAVAAVVKERATAVGLRAVNYSGHSLRAGLVTSAALMGCSLSKIKAQTGHRSDAMVARYVRDADLFDNNAAGAVI